jgi:hypothetical protein
MRWGLQRDCISAHAIAVGAGNELASSFQTDLRALSAINSTVVKGHRNKYQCIPFTTIFLLLWWHIVRVGHAKPWNLQPSASALGKMVD